MKKKTSDESDPDSRFETLSDIHAVLFLPCYCLSTGFISSFSSSLFTIINLVLMGDPNDRPDAGKGTVPTGLERRLLVWYKKYPRLEDIPPTVA